MTPVYFPVSLALEGRPCLVVGGGRVAARKVAALLEAKAGVTVVAPQAVDALLSLERDKKITLILRRFVADDMQGKVLVIAATDDEEVQNEVFQVADRQNIPVNVADVPSRCSFILPAVVRRGPVSVAVSTSGASPALAAYLRRTLEKTVGREYGTAAELLGRLRPHLLEQGLGHEKNRRIFSGLLEQGLVAKLAAGNRDDVRRMAEVACGRQGAAIVDQMMSAAADQRSSG